MKLGILTLARADNYGEILQNYALIQALKKLGHEPMTIDFQWRSFRSKRSWDYSKGERFLRFARNVARKCIKPSRQFRDLPTFEEWTIITAALREFESKYIPMTDFIPDLYDEKQLMSYGFEGYVAGSDIIWNPFYVGSHIKTFFFDFVAEDSPVKRIAYAADWGTKAWPASQKDTEKCALLAKRFDGISVRQKVAVSLCREILGVDAELVLDPSLLLTQDAYRSLPQKEHEVMTSGKVLDVILKPLPEKTQFSNLLSEELNKPIYKFMPTRFHLRKAENGLEKCVFRSVESWISAFANADFVVTDSFHGMAFSLIFEKPFFVIFQEQGMKGIDGRFKAIADFLGIEDRIYTIRDFERFKNHLNILDMDYDSIRERLGKARETSFAFLEKTLKG